MSGAWRLAMLATFALLALHWLWAWALPLPSPGPGWLATAIVFSLPLLPPALAFALRRPRAPLWAGIVALLYFCHGVASVRVDGGFWPWAELALALAIILAAGWPGIAAKLSRRRTSPPPNV